MVKLILIKSPGECGTTKQVCRDELVVYLFAQYIKEIKATPSAWLRYISMREFLRTREKCREARVEGFLLSYFYFFCKIKTTTKGQEFVRQQK